MPTPPEPAELLRQGVVALKAGDRTRARHLLITALRYNPNNDQVWLWLASTSESAEEQRRCLERALEINPRNVYAQRGLAALTLEPIVAATSVEPLQWPPRRADAAPAPAAAPIAHPAPVATDALPPVAVPVVAAPAPTQPVAAPAELDGVSQPEAAAAPMPLPTQDTTPMATTRMASLLRYWPALLLVLIVVIVLVELVVILVRR